MLLFRWTWRDLRARWVQVAVIALVVAVGTGMYAGMLSTTEWAQISYDESYAAVNAHDVRVTLATGSLAAEGELTAAVSDLLDGEAVAEERLIVPIRFDASTPDQTIIVRGAVVGAQVDASVDVVDVQRGRGLGSADAGEPVVILEQNFGSFYNLGASGTLTLAGGSEFEWVGQGVAPEYFIVQPPEGGFFGQAEYGVLFTSVETAQQIAGFGPVVNDLVISSGADPVELAAAVEAVFDTVHPELGATVATGEEDPTRRLLYDDLEGDRQFMAVFAGLIFAGAVAAAFNSTSRMVESIRREFGISMALGVPRWRIAVRPLLVGAEIAFLGVVFGVGLGVVINQAMKRVLVDFLPLPVWQTPFQFGRFAGGAAIGFLAPFLAAAIPVWRALRVQPVEAIRTGHLAARAGKSSLLRWIPGDTFAKIPFRNLFRAPRRTVLTALGIAAAITVLVGMVVMVDSFVATIDAGAAEVTAGSPDRVLVGLDTVRPVDSPEVKGVIAAESVGAAETGLRVPSRVMVGGVGFDLLLEVIDLESDLWHPTFVEGSPAPGGVVLAEKAAEDLGVEVGDVVTVEHPRRQGPLSFSLVESELEVTGLHPHPFRFVAYLDDGDVDLLGMAGLANTLSLEPSPGSDLADVQRELFGNEAVTSVMAAGSVADIIRDFLEQFVGILQIAEIGSILLMVLIAFNSASVAFDERARDHATMLAFGVRRRRIMRMATVESAALGVIATLLGAVGGYGFLRWAVRANISETVPEIGLNYVFTPTLVVALSVLGVVAVALAPLFNWRRLRRLDVPSTLRVME
ncbi:MAG: FtsX-like permease family protein [Acidimicrobiia bacterium]|nr:FtsX-like permease family protein [Acidimicrobiia bacterium]MDH4307757.1 FtsX-like permease family protein [Acidimicrobiia bacterium]